MKRLLTIYILIMCSLVMMAQTDREHIRRGNRLYRQQKPDKAEVDYRKAANKNQRNAQALYNLGCALMQQKKDSDAVVKFQEAARLEKSKKRISMIHHNIGVICQSQKLYDDAIESYKESLRNNPKDDETRYNLALCMRQKKKNQDKNGGQSKDQDKNGKDKKKDQNQQDEKKKQNQQNNQQNEQMSKDNAEQLLQAAMQEEKNTQQKMKKQQAQPKQRRLEKNW